MEIRFSKTMKAIYILQIACMFLAKCTANPNQYLNPDWVEPHAWAVGEKDPLQQLCPQAQVCKLSEIACEKSAQPEYTRLVRTIFDRSKFRFDESTGYLYRTVHIHATEEQLMKLEKLTDPDYIDGLLSEILSQSGFGTVQMVKEITVDMCTEVWKRVPTLPSFEFEVSSRGKHIVINFSMLIASYLVCRHFNINFVVCIFFALTYLLYEYLDYECHNKIKLEQTVEYFYGGEKNPCLSTSKFGWWDYLMGKDSRSACREYLAKQNHQTRECGVIDLFHEFTSNILFKQLSLFITNLANLVQSVSTTYGVIVTAIVLYFLKDVLSTLIYSMFKFIINPSVWSRVIADVSQISSVSPLTATAQHPPEAIRVQAIQGSDIKDINLGKALDLANNQIKLILTKTKIRAQVESSQVELLPIENDRQNVSSALRNSSERSSDENLSISHRADDGNESDSYEEITEDEFLSTDARTNTNALGPNLSPTDFVLLSASSCPSTVSDADDVSVLNDKPSTPSDSKLTIDIELLSHASNDFKAAACADPNIRLET